MVTLILILVATCVIAVTNSQSLYKYEINIDHMEIPNKKSLLIDYGTLRVKKFNRTCYTLDGYLDMLQPFSDDVWGIAEIFAEQGNDYNRLFDKRINNLCTFFKDDQMVTAKVINSTSLGPAIASCPIPVGRIHFYNTHMPTERLLLEPIITKGKVYLKMYIGEVLVSELSLYFILTKQTANS